ncbi:serine protease, partial [Candidatus Omnitrophota bacterium]
ALYMANDDEWVSLDNINDIDIHVQIGYKDKRRNDEDGYNESLAWIGETFAELFRRRMESFGTCGNLDVDRGPTGWLAYFIEAQKMRLKMARFSFYPAGIHKDSYNELAGTVFEITVAPYQGAGTLKWLMDTLAGMIKLREGTNVGAVDYYEGLIKAYLQMEYFFGSNNDFVKRVRRRYVYLISLNKGYEGDDDTDIYDPRYVRGIIKLAKSIMEAKESDINHFIDRIFGEGEEMSEVINRKLHPDISKSSSAGGSGLDFSTKQSRSKAIRDIKRATVIFYVPTPEGLAPARGMGAVIGETEDSFLVLSVAHLFKHRRTGSEIAVDMSQLSAKKTDDGSIRRKFPVPARILKKEFKYKRKSTDVKYDLALLSIKKEYFYNPHLVKPLRAKASRGYEISGDLTIAAFPRSYNDTGAGDRSIFRTRKDETSFSGFGALIHTWLTNPGDSGSPIMDEDGFLVAIHARSSRSRKEHFAISGDAIAAFLKQASDEHDISIPVELPDKNSIINDDTINVRNLYNFCREIAHEVENEIFAQRHIRIKLDPVICGRALYMANDDEWVSRDVARDIDIHIQIGPKNKRTGKPDGYNKEYEWAHQLFLDKLIEGLREFGVCSRLPTVLFRPESFVGYMLENAGEAPAIKRFTFYSDDLSGDVPDESRFNIEVTMTIYHGMRTVSWLREVLISWTRSQLDLRDAHLARNFIKAYLQLEYFFGSDKAFFDNIKSRYAQTLSLGRPDQDQAMIELANYIRGTSAERISNSLDMLRYLGPQRWASIVEAILHHRISAFDEMIDFLAPNRPLAAADCAQDMAALRVIESAA